jgi:hypothetical protein
MTKVKINVYINENDPVNDTTVGIALGKAIMRSELTYEEDISSEELDMKINANEATELIAGVLEELSKSVFQGNHEQDFWWRARVIVGSLERLGIEVEYEND